MSEPPEPRADVVVPTDPRNPPWLKPLENVIKKFNSDLIGVDFDKAKSYIDPLVPFPSEYIELLITSQSGKAWVKNVHELIRFVTVEISQHEFGFNEPKFLNFLYYLIDMISNNEVTMVRVLFEQLGSFTDHAEVAIKESLDIRHPLTVDKVQENIDLSMLAYLGHYDAKSPRFHKLMWNLGGAETRCEYIHRSVIGQRLGDGLTDAYVDCVMKFEPLAVLEDKLVAKDPWLTLLRNARFKFEIIRRIIDEMEKNGELIFDREHREDGARMRLRKLRIVQEHSRVLSEVTELSEAGKAYADTLSNYVYCLRYSEDDEGYRRVRSSFQMIERIAANPAKPDLHPTLHDILVGHTVDKVIISIISAYITVKLVVDNLKNASLISQIFTFLKGDRENGFLWNRVVEIAFTEETGLRKYFAADLLANGFNWVGFQYLSYWNQYMFYRFIEKNEIQPQFRDAYVTGYIKEYYIRNKHDIFRALIVDNPTFDSTMKCSQWSNLANSSAHIPVVISDNPEDRIFKVIGCLTAEFLQLSFIGPIIVWMCNDSNFARFDHVYRPFLQACYFLHGIRSFYPTGSNSLNVSMKKREVSEEDRKIKRKYIERIFLAHSYGARITEIENDYTDIFLERLPIKVVGIDEFFKSSGSPVPTMRFEPTNREEDIVDADQLDSYAYMRDLEDLMVDYGVFEVKPIENEKDVVHKERVRRMAEMVSDVSDVITKRAKGENVQHDYESLILKWLGNLDTFISKNSIETGGWKMIRASGYPYCGSVSGYHLDIMKKIYAKKADAIFFDIMYDLSNPDERKFRRGFLKKYNFHPDMLETVILPFEFLRLAPVKWLTSDPKFDFVSWALNLDKQMQRQALAVIFGRIPMVKITRVNFFYILKHLSVDVHMNNNYGLMDRFALNVMNGQSIDVNKDVVDKVVRKISSSLGAGNSSLDLFVNRYPLGFLLTVCGEGFFEPESDSETDKRDASNFRSEIESKVALNADKGLLKVIMERNKNFLNLSTYDGSGQVLKDELARNGRPIETNILIAERNNIEPKSLVDEISELLQLKKLDEALVLLDVLVDYEFAEGVNVSDLVSRPLKFVEENVNHSKFHLVIIRIGGMIVGKEVFDFDYAFARYMFYFDILVDVINGLNARGLPDMLKSSARKARLFYSICRVTSTLDNVHANRFIDGVFYEAEISNVEETMNIPEDDEQDFMTSWCASKGVSTIAGEYFNTQTGIPGETEFFEGPFWKTLTDRIQTGDCVLCGIENPEYECGQCRAVGYCNENHQEADWIASHSILCPGFLPISVASVLDADDVHDVPGVFDVPNAV